MQHQHQHQHTPPANCSTTSPPIASSSRLIDSRYPPVQSLLIAGDAHEAHPSSPIVSNQERRTASIAQAPSYRVVYQQQQEQQQQSPHAMQLNLPPGQQPNEQRSVNFPSQQTQNPSPQRVSLVQQTQHAPRPSALLAQPRVGKAQAPHPRKVASGVKSHEPPRPRTTSNHPTAKPRF